MKFDLLQIKKLSKKEVEILFSFLIQNTYFQSMVFKWGVQMTIFLLVIFLFKEKSLVQLFLSTFKQKNNLLLEQSTLLEQPTVFFESPIIEKQIEENTIDLETAEEIFEKRVRENLKILLQKEKEKKKTNDEHQVEKKVEVWIEYESGFFIKQEIDAQLYQEFEILDTQILDGFHQMAKKSTTILKHPVVFGSFLFATAFFSVSTNKLCNSRRTVSKKKIWK